MAGLPHHLIPWYLFMQCHRPRVEPGPLDSESSALTMMENLLLSEKQPQNNCLTALRISFILQGQRPGLSAEENNKSTMDTPEATTTSGVSPKKTKIPVDTTNGKKQTENKSRMYKIDTTDFLYLARSIAG